MLFEEGQYHVLCLRPSRAAGAAHNLPPTISTMESCLVLQLILLLSRLFGFLLGSTLAGGGVYYYILEEYKVSNELLTEDIYVRYCI